MLADESAARADLVVDGDELRYHEHRYPIADGTGDGTPRQVHERQHYRLVCWRRGDRELTYRRFFAVSDLAAVRVEDPAVFDATHAEVLRWAAAGELDGIRVDHPDGLRDPAGYLARLRAAAPGCWLVVEKILEVGEELPPWPVEGTTGYDALAEVCGLFVDPSAEAAFTALDTALTGRATSWPELTHECKLAAATGLLAAELARLVRLTPHLPAAEARGRRWPSSPPTSPSTGAIRPPGTATWRRHEPRRAGAARTWSPLWTGSPRGCATPPTSWPCASGSTPARCMAKGVEDTAYYRWSRFVALNEVGGGTAALRQLAGASSTGPPPAGPSVGRPG